MLLDCRIRHKHFKCEDKMNNENKRMADIRHSASKRAQSTLKKPGPQPAQKATSNLAHYSRNLTRKPIKNMDIAKSSSVSRFTPRVQKPAPTNSIQSAAKLSQKNPQKSADIKHTAHPLAQKIQQKPITDNSSKAIKEAAIAEAFAKIAERQNKEKEIIKKRNKIIQISLAVVVLVGIFCYFLIINLPQISVSFASSKSGTQASFPNFSPKGFKHKGLAYTNGGAVVIDFKDKNSDASFSLKQVKSPWDSSAVKDMVEEESSGNFFTTENSGLTIFTYNGNAAWVNGGILYTITGDAPLESSEIQQIALSL